MLFLFSIISQTVSGGILDNNQVIMPYLNCYVICNAILGTEDINTECCVNII